MVIAFLSGALLAWSAGGGPCDPEMMARLDLRRASRPPVELTAQARERLIGSAFEKASELGYVPDRMKFELIYIDGKYLAYFSRPEEGALGGDLTIFLERTGTVACFAVGM